MNSVAGALERSETFSRPLQLEATLTSAGIRATCWCSLIPIFSNIFPVVSLTGRPSFQCG